MCVPFLTMMVSVILLKARIANSIKGLAENVKQENTADCLFFKLHGEL